MGDAGTSGAAGRGGTTGLAGTTGAAGRGGTTGVAGTTGTAGRGGTTGVAGTTGTFDAIAMLRAATLLPRSRIVCALGPMKMIPASSQASANSGDSDKRP